MISAIGLYLLATVGALLPIVNPLSAAPVYLGVTAGMGISTRNHQADMAAIYMAGILLVSLFAGALVLSFFGITIPVLRIAGGLVITRVGFGMLEPSREQKVLPEEESEAQKTDDVAFTPLAMPLLAGPGSIAATIAMATEASDIVHYAGVAAGICIVCFVTWITLRLSTNLMNVIGHGHERRDSSDGTGAHLYRYPFHRDRAFGGPDRRFHHQPPPRLARDPAQQWRLNRSR